jgi:DnaJ domain
MTGRNPWAVLCVAEGAPYQEIQRAFRRRVKETHPDSGGEASEFATVVEAFDVVRRSVPSPHRRRPARPTPYDGWLRPCRPTGSRIDEGRPTPPSSPGSAPGWTPRVVRSDETDFATVLFAEMSALTGQGPVFVPTVITSR